MKTENYPYKQTKQITNQTKQEVIMKTLKLLVITALVSAALMSYAKESPKLSTHKEYTKITLEQAIKDPFMAAAMLSQIDRRFLEFQHQGLYKVPFNYEGNYYLIYGTWVQWKRFFIKHAIPGKIGNKNLTN